MFGWMKPFFTSSEIKMGQHVAQKNDGTLSCVLLKRLIGQWSPRLAQLNLDNELRLSKSEKYKTESKIYNLNNIKKLLLGAGQNSIHAKMTFTNGDKLYLKITGPQRSEWGKRISQCKFPTKEQPQDETETTFDLESAVYKKEEDEWGTDTGDDSELTGSPTCFSAASTLPMEEDTDDVKTATTQMSTSNKTSVALSPAVSTPLSTAVPPEASSPVYLLFSNYVGMMTEVETAVETPPAPPISQPRVPRCVVLPAPVPVQSPVPPDSFSLVTRMGRVFESNYLSRKDSYRVAQ